MREHSIRFAAALALSAIVFLWSCGPHGPSRLPDPEKVSAVTSGFVSKTQPIFVQFTKPIEKAVQDRIVRDKALTFTPSLDGTLDWYDDSNLRFTPSKTLSNGQNYLARFRSSSTDAFLAGTEFEFGFRVVVQRLGVETRDLFVLDPQTPNALVLPGTLVTTDVASPRHVESSLVAVLDGLKLPVEWTHDENSLVHRFTVKNVERKTKPARLELVWDSGPLQAEKGGSKSIEIPAIDQFKLLSAKLISGGDSRLEATFSNPLDAAQDFEGIVRVEGHSNLKMTVQSNVLKIYSPLPWTGTIDLKIERGLLDLKSRKLDYVAQERIAVTNPKPSVKFIGTGGILPTTQGLTVPIETLNVDSISVEALQVFDNNVLQFFQVNTPVQQKELKRVGRVVWKSEIQLDWKASDADQKVRRGLDLSPLLKKFDKGFFVLKMTIHRKNIRWGWHVGSREFPDDPVFWDPNFSTDDSDSENSYWDYYESSEGHSVWEDRDNPLTTSYFLKRWGNPVVSYRNVIVSDIGLSAKRGEDQKLHVFAADLKTTEPLANLPIQVFDFQQQALWKGTTDGTGKAVVKTDIEPAFVVAEKGAQSGYLRLDNSLALSVSSFDVGGEKHEKGVNGFIYGERGIWRPGDKIYLTFLLEDPNKNLPDNLPILFELRNPQGQLIDKQVKTNGINGFYTFPTKTEDSAPTGEWTARVNVAGKVFEKTLRVETIVPNRLKIDLNWGEGTPSLTQGENEGSLSSRWLHGASAAGLRANVRMTLMSASTSFARWPDYVFENPTKSFVPQGSQEVYDGNLSSSGTARLSVNVETRDEPPGKLSALFYTRVFENSGAFSSSTTSVPYDPYSQYVGIQLPKGDAVRGMLLTDVDHIAKIVLVDPQGEPISSGSVHVSLVKLNWRWWWETGSNNESNYSQYQEQQVISSGQVTVRKGIGEWKFRLAYPDWGRFMVKAVDSQGHTSAKVVYIDWPGWAGRSRGEGSGGANILSLSMDKTKYSVGETATVTIPSNASGRALVAIESDGRVEKTEWVTGSDKATTYKFVVTPEMAPNAYVHVSYFQPHLQTMNDQPIRLYGVLGFKAENPASHIKPTIVAPNLFVPGQKNRVTIKEASGRPMTYTLAIVDEGLLGITNYKTPDVWSAFNQRRASLLKSWDLYDWVSGAFSGQLANILAIGGDSDVQDASKIKPNRFPPVVKFYEPVTLGAGEVKNLDVEISNYIGEVRLMVVAAHKRTYGIHEVSVPVKSPIMAMPTLPRVLSPGDVVTIPVTVFSESKQSGVVTSLQASGNVQVVGTDAQTVDFTSPGEKLLTFNLKALKQVGPAQIRFRVQSPEFSSEQEINLDVRVPALPVSKTLSGPPLKPGEIWKVSVDPIGFAGTNKATLELSQIPPINLEKRIGYLIQYPHGCIEQTTSSVFPQLYLDKIAELDADRLQKIQTNVTASFSRLATFQLDSGGFSYWPGEGQVHYWGSNYAGHFLIEAKRAGYAVPDELYSRWLQFEKQTSESWSSGDSLDQAYRLYLLALAGEAALGAMNRFAEQPLSDASRAYLAAAYQRSGLTENALRVISKSSTKSGATAGWGETFGSPVRDTAILLLGAVQTKQWTTALVHYNELVKTLGSDAWLSTQSTAYALMGVSAFVQEQIKGQDMQASVVWRGTSSEVTFAKAIYARTLVVAQDKASELVVTNTGKSLLIPRVQVTGVPAQETEKAFSNGVAIDMVYGSLSPDWKSLTQGEDLVVTATVTNTSGRDLRYLALTEMVPAGWELINPRLSGDQVSGTYQDFRDDRLTTYFDLPVGKSIDIAFKANSAYLGRFWAPLVYVEAMYDATVSALEPGAWVEVKTKTRR